MRFFTFREIALPTCELYLPNHDPKSMEIESGETYYLRKESFTQGNNTLKIEKTVEDSLKDESMCSV